MIELRRRSAVSVVITIGGCDLAVREAIDLLGRRGTPPATCVSGGSRSRRAWPNSLRQHEYCYVVEQNRDAQLRTLFLNETSVPKEKLRSILQLRRISAERAQRD